MEKPPQVQKARKEGDTKALSAMGRKGGLEAAKTKAAEAARLNINTEERVAELAQTETLSDEGDVLPPNPMD